MAEEVQTLKPKTSRRLYIIASCNRNAAKPPHCKSSPAAQ
jgi:hypothetical protein